MKRSDSDKKCLLIPLSFSSLFCWSFNSPNGLWLMVILKYQNLPAHLIHDVYYTDPPSPACKINLALLVTDLGIVGAILSVDQVTGSALVCANQHS